VGLANHTSRKHSDRIIKRYKGLVFGERDPKTRINKLDPSRPSYTIIVGSDHGGGKGHVHPYEPREVSPRESARIQTFPDWWAFSGTTRHPIRQVGNAVPPLMAALIGREIVSALFGGERKSLIEIIKILGQQHLFDENIKGL
jgi:DNA (cytosine-5)-methyltransferase 1